MLLTWGDPYPVFRSCASSVSAFPTAVSSEAVCNSGQDVEEAIWSAVDDVWRLWRESIGEKELVRVRSSCIDVVVDNVVTKVRTDAALMILAKV